MFGSISEAENCSEPMTPMENDTTSRLAADYSVLRQLDYKKQSPTS